MKLLKQDDQVRKDIAAFIIDAVTNSALDTLSVKFDVDTYLKAKHNKATIQYTQHAHMKLRKLVETSSTKECAWHGIVHRINDNTFLVSDILCYPQNITAATVESDDEQYPLWLDSLDDDTINNIKMQGHSHVRMGVTPSSTDITNWETFKNNVPDNSFYILMITNIPGTCNYCIIDKQNNIQYDNADVIEVVVSDTGFNYNEWAAATLKDNVIERVVVPTYHTGYAQYHTNMFGTSTIDERNYLGNTATVKYETAEEVLERLEHNKRNTVDVKPKGKPKGKNKKQQRTIADIIKESRELTDGCI